MQNKKQLNLKNKIKESKTYIDIYLDLPEDLPFDIDEIIIRYKGENIEIPGKLLPNVIKDNMSRFFTGNIKEFISFVELNLETFLKGELPESDSNTKIQTMTRKPILMNSNYKLPISQKPCSDICIISKRKNISIFTVIEIRCDVKCNKCGQLNHISNSIKCKKCNSMLILLFEPTMGTMNLAYFSVRECFLLALFPVYFILVCEECDSIYQTKGCVDNEALKFNCYNCYTELCIEVERFTFTKTKALSSTGEKQTLIGDGTCKHYKKSQRWFRFPCCSRLYSCDICHDEQSDHLSELAKKMVCGLCKTEQTVSNACKCGMDVAKKSSQFWEGGKGSRNKATMSKKDSKKYKGK